MSQETDSVSSLLKLLEKVESARNGIFSAKTPQEVQEWEIKLANATRQLNNTWSEIDEDVAAEFRSAFKNAGGDGAPERRYREKAWRSRVKSRQAFERGTESIRGWGIGFSQNTRINRAKADLERKYRRAVELGDDRQAKDLASKIKSLPRQTPVPDDPSVRYTRKNGQAYYVRADSHMRMSVNTAFGINRNMGIIAAAAKKSGYVIVQDGPSCGKEGHDSPEKVNGQVWTVDEAFKYPLSHPNCTRTFSVAAGPPGSKKLKEQMRGLLASKETNKKPGATSTVVNAVVIGSITANLTKIIITNPFVKTFARQILEDTQMYLAPWQRQALERLTSYAPREADAHRLYAAKGQSREDFVLGVRRSFDDDLANEKFINMNPRDIIELRPSQATTLGLPIKVRKSELLESLDDYGDYVIHRETLDLSVEQRVGVRNLFREVNDSLGREAALKYHIDKAPGANLDRSWTRVIYNWKTAYAKDPYKAKIQLARLGGAILDPTPWIRVPLGQNFRFMIGMPSRSRQDLAEKIFRKMTAGGSLTDVEIKWAESLGMDLSDFKEVSFGKDDVIDMIAPRLSFIPGSPIHATVSLERGVIKPIVRLFPKGTYSRYLSLDSHLGRLDTKEFLRRVNSEGWRKALEESADPEILTAVNFFRNSPVVVGLKMTGAHVTGAALKLLPENRFFRYSYHFSFDHKRRYSGLTVDELIEIADRREIVIPKGATKARVIESLAEWDERARKELFKDMKNAYARGESMVDFIEGVDPELKQQFFRELEKMTSGVQVLPNRSFGFNLHDYSISAQELMIKLRMAGYSLLRISKETRYGYDELLEIFNSLEGKFDDVVSILKSERDSIHSLNDLLISIKGAVFSRNTRVAQEALQESLDDFVIGKVTSKAAGRDLQRFSDAWKRLLPDMPVPRVEIVDDLPHPMMEFDGRILIRQDVIDEWPLYGRLRRRGVGVGHFPADTQDPVASLFHEASHVLIRNMDRSDKRRILVNIIDSYDSWPDSGYKEIRTADFKFLEKWFQKDVIQKVIGRRVSGYGATSVDEMIAEAFSEYMTSPNPRRIASTVGKTIEDQFGTSGDVAVRLPNLKIPSNKISQITNNLRKKVSSFRVGNKTLSIDEMSIDQIDHRRSVIAQNIISDAEAYLDKLKKSGYEFLSDPNEYRPKDFFTSPGGVKIDKELIDRGLRVQDIDDVLKELKRLNPDFKMPEIHMRPVGVSLTAEDITTAMYDFKNNRIKIAELFLEIEDLQDQAIELAGSIGYLEMPWRDRSAIYNILYHEIGHYAHLNLKAHDQISLLKFLFSKDSLFSEFGISSEEARSALSALDEIALDYDGLDLIEFTTTRDLIVDIQIKNIAKGDEETIETVETLLMKMSPTEYGRTAFYETIAEMFVRGSGFAIEGSSVTGKDRVYLELFERMIKFSSVTRNKLLD